MKNKFTYYFTFIIIIGLYLSSCKKDGYSVTETGLRYHIYDSKKQESAKLGDILKMHLIYKNSKDSILYDSKILGDSFLIELTKPSFKGGLEEGFAMMGEGDSASFLVSADSVFDKLFHQTLPSYIQIGDILRFDVRLNKIMSREEMNAFLKQKANLNSNIKTENDLIHDYLTSNKLEVSPIKDGVYYIPFVAGKGNQPKSGDEVTIKYLARSLNGIAYDASDKNGGPIKIILGKGGYLPSFIDAILAMKKGGVSRVVLSSQNAYGAAGFGPVPPNSPLVFDLELMEIKPKSPL